MTKKLVFLNTATGVGHLRMLVNKPVQGFHIVHSFPEEHLQQFEGKKWEEGTWLLAHFIRLAEATRNDNKPQMMISMEALGKKTGGEWAESIFANEVVHALEPFMDIKRITTKLGTEHVHFPLTVKPNHEGGQPLILHPDGFFASTSFTSPLWEQSVRESIEKSGVVYLPVWSVNWLKNPGVEARLLASKIIKLDSTQINSDLAADSEVSLEDKLKG